MTREEIINGLKMSMELTLFDPSTGEVAEPWQLNDINRTAYDAYKGAIELLKKQQWIPVTERMPKIEEAVLVSDGKYVWKDWRLENKEWVFGNNFEITAWMPLPELY